MEWSVSDKIQAYLDRNQGDNAELSRHVSERYVQDQAGQCRDKPGHFGTFRTIRGGQNRTGSLGSCPLSPYLSLGFLLWA